MYNVKWMGFKIIPKFVNDLWWNEQLYLKKKINHFIVHVLNYKKSFLKIYNY